MGHVHVTEAGQTRPKSEEDIVKQALAALNVASFPSSGGAAFALTELKGDPANPAEGKSIIWQSDGTGTGSDGDVLGKVTANSVTSVRRGFVELMPSGDVTGVTDRTAIQAALDAGVAVLAEGTFYLDQALTISSGGTTFTGSGYGTVVRPSTLGAHEVLVIGGVTWRHTIVSDMGLYGGSDCVHLSDAKHIDFFRVRFYGASRHGLYMSGGNWSTYFNQCDFYSNTSDGVSAVSVTNDIGNADSFQSCKFWANGGTGLHSSGATGLSVIGCLFEQNDIGIKLGCDNGSQVATSIAYCYFESNQTSQLRMETTVGNAIAGVTIDGCYFLSAYAGDALIDATGSVVGGVRQLYMPPGNYMYSTTTTNYIDFGNLVRLSDVFVVEGKYDWTSTDGSTKRSLYSVQYGGGVGVGTMTDANASNGMIYYSSDQAALCYKDSVGAVKTIDLTAT